MHPLLEAIARGDVAETRRLCEDNPSWLAGEHAFRPLHVAALKGDSALVACLLDMGADPNVTGHFGHESPYNGLIRAIHAAAGEGHASVVDLLLQRGASITGGNRYFTPLLLAANARHRPVVKTLVKAGATADIFVASTLGKADSVKTLLERDPTRAKRRTELGETALMFAAAHGHTHIVRLLLDASADPCAADIRRNHVLDYAAGIGHYEHARRDDTPHAAIARLLLERGADPDSTNWRGVRPLHHAARSGRTQVAQALLDHGADPDAPDHAGETPLWRIIVHPAELELAALLISRGANVNSRDKRNRRPLTLARGPAMKRLLKKHGAK